MDKEHLLFVILGITVLTVISLIFITNYESLIDISHTSEEIDVIDSDEAEEVLYEDDETHEESPVEIDYHQEYIENSRHLDLSHDFGLFETKLIRIGWYENPEEGFHESIFRADIWVKNAGNAAEEFKETNAFIQKTSGGKYNITESHFNGENIVPGEEREGYLLFETVPSNISGDVRFSIGTSRSYSVLFGIQLHSPHVYLITL